LAALGGRGSHFVPGVATGDDGSGFRWETRITPTGSLTIAGPPPERILLYRVSVTESWSTGHGTRREVRLTTARLEEEASATP
ncbi:MAG TPA: hypothetical protein VG848_05795, partial [Acetobacteraceae bacterium]|nr:hypothetical protein [Acetobacteraceae bacterium]